MKHLFKTEYGFCDILRVEENGQVKWYHIDSDYNLTYPYTGASSLIDELEKEYQQIRRGEKLEELGI